MAKKRRTLGCLFYIALVLLVLVVLLFNRGRVQEVLEKTGFTRLFGKEAEEPVLTPLEAEEEGEDKTTPPRESEPEEIVITVEKKPAADTVPE